jgi:hypothetical protein
MSLSFAYFVTVSEFGAAAMFNAYVIHNLVAFVHRRWVAQNAMRTTPDNHAGLQQYCRQSFRGLGRQPDAPDRPPSPSEQ